jgi:2-polyprenyl-3-methyl-5-hydroxy-6-metoxy-1,4-benzoquinol methylase
MRKPIPDPSWPESWLTSFQYDVLEVFDPPRSGHSYALVARTEHALAAVERVTRPGARILDVAAAQGNLTLALAERGFEVTWNDLRSELADYVRLKHERGIVHYSPGNAFQLTGDFDTVLIGEVIEHVAHPDEFLAAIAKLVKPGGHMIMTTPNGEYFRNSLPKFSDCPDPSVYEATQFRPDADGHIFLLHLAEVEAFAKKVGLRVIESLFYANPLTHGHLKLRYLHGLLPRQFVRICEAITRRLPFARKFHSGMVVTLVR